MNKHFKLPDVDYSCLEKATKNVVQLLSTHKNKILIVTAGGLLVDNIWGRICRKKNRREYEKNNLKHQEIERKHETEIRACKEQADLCQEAQNKVAVLERIVQNIVADGGDFE